MRERPRERARERQIAREGVKETERARERAIEQERESVRERERVVGRILIDSYMYIWVVLRKRAPKCDIELFALDLLVLVANRLVQCATYTV